MAIEQTTASDVYEALERGDHFTREEAQQGLGDLDESVRAELRGLLIDGLEKVAPNAVEDERDPSRRWTRSWLVSSLARLSEGRDEPFQCVERYIAETGFESFDWVRYWALAGLVVSEHPNRTDVAERVGTGEGEPKLLRWLATAVRAVHDDACRRRIDEALDRLNGGESGDLYWVLRGLRIAPVPGTERRIAAVIDRQDDHGDAVYDAATYQAVVALGAVGRDGVGRKDAALALHSLVELKAGELMWSEARARALEGLGRLQYEPSAAVLLDSMCDGNPAIVQQAALALERLLEPERAVDRVVERVETAPALMPKAASALRWMKDQRAIANRLAQILVGGSSTQEVTARELLTEMGGASAYSKLRVRARSVDRYEQVLEAAEERVQELFNDSITEAREGFKLATWMDLAVFALGWVLILVSAGFALVNEGTLVAWAGAGTGVLAVLYSLFFAQPRQNIPQEVGHLMFMKVVFLGYLRQLHQVDQAFSRRMLSEADDALGSKEVAEFRELVRQAKADAVADIRDVPVGRKRTRRGAGGA